MVLDEQATLWVMDGWNQGVIYACEELDMPDIWYFALVLQTADNIGIIFALLKVDSAVPACSITCF